MADAVLDSSAVLAVLQNEPGAATVTSVLEGAIICAVNFAEVVGKMIERGGSPEVAGAVLATINVSVADFDERLARRTGELLQVTHRQGLSLGDRACIALGEREQAPVYTADRRWLQAGLAVDIRMIC
jgi:ribonuclease VapC